MTPNIPTMLMAADFEDKHSDLLAAARAGKPHEPKTGCAPSPALMKEAEAFLEKMAARRRLELHK